jgi:geranylgeranyl pyrophosphate synthase
MWKERQAELLREEIEALLAPLSNIASFYDLVKEPLTKARRGLAPDAVHDQPWPLIPLMVCEAICGHYEQALPAAAAFELLKAAAEVFDDIEDADSSDSLSTKYGSAIATNAATTLLVLAEKAITRLRERGVADYITVCVMNVVNSYYTTACVGQHLDLSLNSEISISEDTYLRVIGMKSASQIECACKIGALLAKANQELVDAFAKFGQNLGMASQITNDIQGIIRGNDILKHKITLPVIYALAATDNEVRNQLKFAFGKPTELMPDAAQIRDMLFSTGAIHYATIKMEFHKQMALDILSKSEVVGTCVERLKLFLE